MKKSFFNKAIRIMLFTNGLVLISSAMIAPIYAIFVEKVGGDLMDASVAGAIFTSIAGLVTLFSSKLSDEVKENELILVVGYTIIGFGFLLYLFVSSVLFLFIIQAIIGLGEAIYTPAFDAIYSKHLDKKEAGLEWGAWEALDYFTRTIGALAGGVIATLFGFKILFITMALLCFLSALYILHLKRNIL
jgi:MFS family permease